MHLPFGKLCNKLFGVNYKNEHNSKQITTCSIIIQNYNIANQNKTAQKSLIYPLNI